MSVVSRKLQKGKLVHWIVFAWQGKRVWERVGFDKRAADRLLKARIKEVKDGTYEPPKRRKPKVFAQYAADWLGKRTGRNANDERRAVENYVLPREWFASKPIEVIRVVDVDQLVLELKTTVSKKTQKPLSPKTVANIYGTLRTMFHDAHREELVHGNPCDLKKGTLSRRSKKRRAPYEVDEMRDFIVSDVLDPDVRMWIALAYYTGMREGEVCGRRFRDYDSDSLPLGCLTVDTQYEDQPLKTEEETGERSRVVPVHPELAALLAWWRSTGFEVVYCRKPTADDFIVPHRADKGAHAHTKSTAYKMWRKACLAAGVTNRSLHSVRHTFISLCRRNGARKDVIERVTHNACGDIIDRYTTWDWTPLCEVVGLLTPMLTEDAKGLETQWRRRESKTARLTEGAGIPGNALPDPGDGDPPKAPGIRKADAGCDASQQGRFDADGLTQRDSELEQWLAAEAGEMVRK